MKSSVSNQIKLLCTIIQLNNVLAADYGTPHTDFKKLNLRGIRSLHTTNDIRSLEMQRNDEKKDIEKGNGILGSLVGKLFNRKSISSDSPSEEKEILEEEGGNSLDSSLIEFILATEANGDDPRNADSNSDESKSDRVPIEYPNPWKDQFSEIEEPRENAPPAPEIDYSECTEGLFHYQKYNEAGELQLDYYLDVTNGHCVVIDRPCPDFYDEGLITYSSCAEDLRALPAP